MDVEYNSLDTTNITSGSGEAENVSDSVDQQLVEIILNSVDPPLPSTWRDDPLFRQCLSELAACSLTRLHNEPTHLRETLQRVQRENQELAVAHYDTFILTAQCSHSVLQQFHSVQSTVQHVKSEDIPTLEANCRHFLQRGQAIIAAQKRNQMTLQRHNQILEILELPQLMDTCVRGGYYDEALELVAYIRRLQRRQFTHAQEKEQLSILPRLAKEVHHYTEILLGQLINQLLGPLQLPACLKVVGYLRRMEVFTEAELRLLFLQCRDTWLTGLLRAIPREDPAAHATKVMEQARIHLFDIVTQFRAVFTEEESPFLSSNSTGSGLGVRRTLSLAAGGGFAGTDADPHYRNAVMNVTPAQQTALFHSWLVRRVILLLEQVLRKDVERLLLAPDTSSMSTTNKTASSSPASSAQQKSTSSSWGSQDSAAGSRAGALASLLAQAMYFGLSFGRVGCDFRPHVAALFDDALEAHFTNQVRIAVEEFREALPVMSLTTFPTSASDAARRQAQPNQAQAASGEIVAPTQLLNYPLLAHLCNRLLAVLNELRLCCPVNLIFRVLDSTQTAFQEVCHALLSYHAASQERFTPRELEAFQLVCECFLVHLVPHVEHCLMQLMALVASPSSASAASLPVSLQPLFVEALKQWRQKHGLLPMGAGKGRWTARSAMQILESTGGHRTGCIDWLTLAKLLLPILPNEGHLRTLLATHLSCAEEAMGPAWLETLRSGCLPSSSGENEEVQDGSPAVKGEFEDNPPVSQDDNLQQEDDVTTTPLTMDNTLDNSAGVDEIGDGENRED